MCDTILAPFCYVIGLVLKFCCNITGNHYALALFVFTLLMQIVLLPIAIKQQKSSVKMSKIRPKEMLIREKYKGRDDKATQQKLQQEIQELYQKEGYNQFAGCLPLLVQFPIIFILYAVIRAPLTYTTGSVTNGQGVKVTLESQYDVAIDIYEGAAEAINDRLAELGVEVDTSGDESQVSTPASGESAVSEELSEASEASEEISAIVGSVSGDTSETSEEAVARTEIETLQALKKDYLASAETFEKNKTGTISEFQLTEFILYNYRDAVVKKLAAVGVSDTAVAENIPADMDFDADFVKAIPDFSYFGNKTLIDTPSLNVFGNPSWLLLIPLLVFGTSVASSFITKKFSSQPQTTEANPMMDGCMKWGLPVMSAYFTFKFPAAIGIYWIYRTVIGVAQTIIIAKVMPIPQVTPEELAQYKKELKEKKKKVISIEVDEDDDSYDNLIIKTKKSDNGAALNGDKTSGDKPKTPLSAAPLKKDDRKDGKDGKNDDGKGQDNDYGEED